MEGDDMESDLEVIDAFVDGERVDVPALKAALAQPEARDYFVDAWMLREAVREESAGVVTPGLKTRGSIEPSRGSSSIVRRWLVPAAFAAGLAGGYVAGYRTMPGGSATVAPVQSRSVPEIASVPSPAPAVFPVPAATRVIQLEFRDLAETNKSGGN